MIYILWFISGALTGGFFIAALIMVMYSVDPDVKDMLDSIDKEKLSIKRQRLELEKAKLKECQDE